MDRARLAILLGLALACASAPDPPAPGTSQVFGHLQLVPREGVKATGGGAAYGDRRLRDVRLVDYSKPGFAVVFAAGEPPEGQLALTIRDARVGPRLEPDHAAVGAAGRISVRNQTGSAQLLSYPAAQRVERLEPGEELAFPVPRAGEQRLFLLSAPGVAATVFAAPGPFDVVSPSGRFRLTDLRPGQTELHVWHPRFPPARRRVELPADERVRVDFEIGVGREAEAEQPPAEHAEPEDGHAH